MRFAPEKSVAGYAKASRDGFNWRIEPAVAGYARLEHRSEKSGNVIPVPVSAAPVIIPGVGVVVAGYDGTLRLFDPLLEKIYWTRRLSAPIYAPLLWLPSSENFVAADTSGNVSCFSIKGDLCWSCMLNKPVYPTMELLEKSGTIVVCCFEGELNFVDCESGDIVAQAGLPRPWFSKCAPKLGYRDPYASPIQIGPDCILVSAANTLTAFDGQGEVAWQYVGTAQFRASPTASQIHSRVMAMSVDGICSLLDTYDGKLVSRIELDDKIVASAATSGSISAIGTASGSVHGIDISNGQQAWTRSHGSPFDYTGFSLLPDGCFICTNTRGNVIARDSSDGRFLWESSQLIGLTDHSPRIDTTPICSPNGLMYAGSYDGALYAFIFQDRAP